VEGALGRNRVSDYTIETITARTKASGTAAATAVNPSTTVSDDSGPLRFGTVNGDLADARTFNASFTWKNVPGLPEIDRDYLGTTIRDKPVFGLTGDWDATRAGDNNVYTQLNAGWSQDVSDGVITYAFFTHKHALGLNNSPWFGEGKGYTPFTEAQKAAARIAIQNWDELITATFVEVSPSRGARDWAQKTADIWLANTFTGPAQAWAYYPGYGKPYDRVAGDVWIADPRYNGSNAQLQPGFYGLQTLNHELGHAIGLSHPGDYNFGDDNDGDGQPDPITYEGDAFYFQDSHQYTIMSYFDSYETGAQNIDWNLMRFVYPSTPMVHDVAVVQAKYGADMTTRTGNSTYGFNSTADVTNAAMKFNVGEMFTIFTIWDAGGIDTLDLSGYYTPSIIDLREGAYSSAGGAGAYDAALAGTQLSLAQINANNAAAGLGPRNATLYEYYFNGVEGVNEGLSWKQITGTGSQFLMEQNIGIAYGAIIENAKGGHGNDRINGNQATNEFTGGAGSDTFVIARYGPTDTNLDKIMDFATGVDKIDLTEFASVTSSNVTYSTGKLLIDTDNNGVADFTVDLLGAAINTTTDIIYAG
jgi:hypothetical protein